LMCLMPTISFPTMKPANSRVASLDRRVEAHTPRVTCHHHNPSAARRQTKERAHTKPQTHEARRPFP
jgi:hypothetical protein